MPRAGGMLDQTMLEVEAMTNYLNYTIEKQNAAQKKSEKKGGR